MDRKAAEDRFLDLLEGTLDEREGAELRTLLDSDASLRESFEAYKRVVAFERAVAAEPASLNANFAVKVMDEVESREVGVMRGVVEWVREKRRVLIPSLALMTTLIVVVRVSNDYDIQEQRVTLTSGVKALTDGTARPLVSKLEASEERPAGAGGAREGKNNKAAEQESNKSGRDDARAPSVSVAAPEGAPINVETSSLADLESKSKDGLSRGKGNIQDESHQILEENDLAAIPLAPHEPVVQLEVLDDLKVGAENSKKESDKGQLTAQLVEGRAEDSEKRRRQVEERSGGVLRKTLPDTSQPKQDVRGPAPAKPAAAASGVLSDSIILPSARVLPQQQDNEEYSGYEENKRLNVAESPSSTFSIDVDTASYTNARRFLKEGQLPPRDSIRIEEFINYFDYQYPVQYEKPFGLSYEIAPSPLEPDRLLLKLGIKAKEVRNSDKSWNLVFLVDVSGSMSDFNKLPLVKKSLRLVVDQMRASDKIAIVTYAGDARVALEPTTANEKSRILAAIDGLSSGGSTNGSGGITVAYELAERAKIAKGVNRVILATDGDFNVGVTDKGELIKMIEAKRQLGVTLTSLGFGYGNIKDGTLEQLADKGNGNYFYIDSFQEARKVFETDLTGTIEVVAKDVKLQMEFNPAKIASYRLIGYENRRLNREDFNNDSIDAGEIGAGHTVTAMYEIVMKDSPLAKKLADDYRYQKQESADAESTVADRFPAELGFLKIRYKEPDGSESNLLQFSIETKSMKSAAGEASSDFRFVAAVSYFAHILRGSQYAGGYTLKDVLTLAEGAKGEDKRGYRQEFIELVKNAAALMR